MRCFLMLTAVINRKRVAMHAPGPYAMASPLKKQKRKKNASSQIAAHGKRFKVISFITLESEDSCLPMQIPLLYSLPQWHVTLY